jgi:hypothetical protein
VIELKFRMDKPFDCFDEIGGGGLAHALKEVV